MTRLIPWIIGILFLATFIMGCNDDTCDDCAQTDGDTTEGDTADGDTTDGDTTDGDATDGDTTDGDTTDGDMTDGDEDLDGDEEIPPCGLTCHPGEEGSEPYCPRLAGDNFVCRCNADSSEWEDIDCTSDCANQGFSAAVGCGFNLDGEQTCLCEHDCSNAEAVAALCEAEDYNNCTCAAADPCGWAGNDFCQDSFCTIYYPDDHFDDTDDCDDDCSNAEDVQAFCDGNTINNCTCAPDDPCGWANNDLCDDFCEMLYPDNHFDDSADCQ